MCFASRGVMTAAVLTLSFYKPAGMDIGDSRECVRGRTVWEPSFTSLAVLRRAPRSNCRCRAMLPSGILQPAGSAGSGPAAQPRRRHIESELGQKHDETANLRVPGINVIGVGIPTVVTTAL